MDTWACIFLLSIPLFYCLGEAIELFSCMMFISLEIRSECRCDQCEIFLTHQLITMYKDRWQALQRGRSAGAGLFLISEMTERVTGNPSSAPSPPTHSPHELLQASRWQQHACFIALVHSQRLHLSLLIVFTFSCSCLCTIWSRNAFSDGVQMSYLLTSALNQLFTNESQINTMSTLHAHSTSWCVKARS